MERQGGARGVRRRTDLVRPRRPRLRDARRPHPDARRRLQPHRGHRGAVRALAAGRAAAPDERRPGRDPCRHRRRRTAARAAQGRALPGVLGAAARRRSRARSRPRSAPRRPSPHPASSRPSRRPTSWSSRRPTRSSRSARSSAVPGIRGRRPPRRRRRWSAVARSSAARPVRGMADKVLAAVGVESTASAVAQHYGSRVRRPARRLAGRHLGRRPGGFERRSRNPRPGGAAVDDRRGHHRRDGRAALDLAEAVRREEARSEVFPVTGLPEVAAGDDLAR